ncbi:MAG: hypothetical protein ABNO82_00390 [Candidatus Shikimatogenerans sp. Tder]|uniref:Uncharacterized protein n=1 Tax=Candidatus Shikimatogenerans sp. Tder TaxID=3158566 RepID=A0AAU7QRG5_9FLAO
MYKFKLYNYYMSRKSLLYKQKRNKKIYKKYIYKYNKLKKEKK